MAQPNDIINTLDQNFAKLPALPKGGRDFLVTVLPWINLIFGVLLVLAALSAFGIGAVLSPFAALGGGAGTAASLMIIAVLGIVEGVLMVASFPSLRKNAARGWTLTFWAAVVSVVSSVVSISISGVVFALIGLYLLFQVRSYYK